MLLTLLEKVREQEELHPAQEELHPSRNTPKGVISPTVLMAALRDLPATPMELLMDKMLPFLSQLVVQPTWTCSRRRSRRRSLVQRATDSTVRTPSTRIAVVDLHFLHFVMLDLSPSIRRLLVLDSRALAAVDDTRRIRETTGVALDLMEAMLNQEELPVVVDALVLVDVDVRARLDLCLRVHRACTCACLCVRACGACMMHRRCVGAWVYMCVGACA